MVARELLLMEKSGCGSTFEQTGAGLLGAGASGWAFRNGRFSVGGGRRCVQGDFEASSGFV